MQIYSVNRAPSAIAVDGRLDDEAWKNAPWTNDFVRSLDALGTRQRTRARLLHDDTTLFVGFEVEDDFVVTPFHQNDEPLYTSEVCEIFLQPGGTGRPYFEIELSPNDLLFDASFTGRRQGMDIAWDSGARHAVNMGPSAGARIDRGWTGELAIPFARLGVARSLEHGETWRFNLYRLDADRAGSTEGLAYSAPLVGDFHNLDRFAFLRFE